MKQLKEDGNQFRKWKQEKDKEVMQLKAKVIVQNMVYITVWI